MTTGKEIREFINRRSYQNDVKCPEGWKNRAKRYLGEYAGLLEEEEVSNRLLDKLNRFREMMFRPSTPTRNWQTIAEQMEEAEWRTQASLYRQAKDQYRQEAKQIRKFIAALQRAENQESPTLPMEIPASLAKDAECSGLSVLAEWLRSGRRTYADEELIDCRREWAIWMRENGHFPDDAARVCGALDDHGNFLCTNCMNCVDCTDCTNCHHCRACKRCEHCIGCVNCEACLYCWDCHSCSICINCMDLKNGHDREDMRGRS